MNHVNIRPAERESSRQASTTTPPQVLSPDTCLSSSVAITPFKGSHYNLVPSCRDASLRRAKASCPQKDEDNGVKISSIASSEKREQYNPRPFARHSDISSASSAQAKHIYARSENRVDTMPHDAYVLSSCVKVRCRSYSKGMTCYLLGVVIGAIYATDKRPQC